MKKIILLTVLVLALLVKGNAQKIIGHILVSGKTYYFVPEKVHTDVILSLTNVNNEKIKKVLRNAEIITLVIQGVKVPI